VNGNFKILDNLLSNEELLFITDCLENKKIDYTEKNDLRFANFVLSNKDQLNQKCYDLFQNIYYLIKKDIESFYSCQVHEEHFNNIIQYNIGEFVGPHLDTQPQHDSFGKLISQASTPSGKPVRHFSTVFYINDSYEGGEICFPDFDFTLKPSAGCSLTWPSDAPYNHYTKPVTSGKKWMTPTFWNIIAED
jgi:hypothetical protein